MEFLKKILEPVAAAGFVLKVLLVVILCPVLSALLAICVVFYILYGLIMLPFRPLISWIKNRK